jgi:paraquat-inducible protein B
MSEAGNTQDTAPPAFKAAPEPVLRRRSGPSLVWLIPLLTALIGGWLIYKTFSEKGPALTISFRHAEGIEVGKTRIKYKNLDIGVVEGLRFSEDFARVVVLARLNKEAAPFLKRGTRFWVVKPSLGVRGVSGLSTLISGAYIELEPGQGAVENHFVGLEVPPVVAADEAGRRIELVTTRLGSIDRGSPLYYQGILAGEVLGYEMANDYRSVLVHAFVKEPFDRLLRSSTRFWHASGVDVSIGADGLRVQTESLQAMLFGGIAFDTPDAQDGATENTDGLVFTLYDDKRSIQEHAYTSKAKFVLYFDESVRGLAVGAPVEFKGIKIGAVTGIRLEYEPKSGTFLIPVVIEIEPERVFERAPGHGEGLRAAPQMTFQALVKRGLRARLQAGNLLTGQLFIELDMHPKSKIRQAQAAGPYPELPTIPGSIGQMTVSLESIITKLDRIDLEGIGADLKGTLAGTSKLANQPEMQRSVADLSASLASLRSILRKVDEHAEPIAANLDKALVSARETLTLLDGVLAPDSPLHDRSSRLAEDVSEAARSIRALVDMLQRDPQSVLFGKKVPPEGSK